MITSIVLLFIFPSADRPGLLRGDGVGLLHQGKVEAQDPVRAEEGGGGRGQATTAGRHHHGGPSLTTLGGGPASRLEKGCGLTLPPPRPQERERGPGGGQGQGECLSGGLRSG